MVLQINSLRLVRYTDVDYHQYVAQIRVVLRRLEAAAPFGLSTSPSSEANRIVYFESGPLQRHMVGGLGVSFLFCQSNAPHPGGRRNIYPHCLYSSLVGKQLSLGSVGSESLRRTAATGEQLQFRN